MKLPIANSTANRVAAGFTMIELIIVLTVVAILSASAILRLSSASARGVTTNADQLRQDIAHMQMLALTWGVPLRLSIAADGKSYAVSCRATGTGCASVAAIPLDPATGASFQTALTDSVIVSPASGTLDFDSLGRPVSGSTLLSSKPAAAFGVAGGGQSMTVSVQPITGLAIAN